MKAIRKISTVVLVILTMVGTSRANETTEIFFDAEGNIEQLLGKKEWQAMQIVLSMMGYGVGRTDGILRAHTRRAIGRWQEDEGYKGTGHLTSRQYLEISERSVKIWKFMQNNPNDANPFENLGAGDEDDERRAVKVIQLGLNELGYTAGPVDGVYGKLTRQALGQWQEDSGFEATGRMGNSNAQMARMIFEVFFPGMILEIDKNKDRRITCAEVMSISIESSKDIDEIIKEWKKIVDILYSRYNWDCA